MTEAQEILKELTEKFDLTKETLAAKFQVHSNTIIRWTSGETEPTYAELKLLKQILNGYRTHNK